MHVAPAPGPARAYMLIGLLSPPVVSTLEAETIVAPSRQSRALPELAQTTTSSIVYHVLTTTSPVAEMPRSPPVNPPFCSCSAPLVRTRNETWLVDGAVRSWRMLRIAARLLIRYDIDTVLVEVRNGPAGIV